MAPIDNTAAKDTVEDAVKDAGNDAGNTHNYKAEKMPQSCTWRHIGYCLFSRKSNGLALLFLAFHGQS